MNPSASVFKAIADPTRREIIQLLVTNPRPLTINDLSDNFDITRQAVTRHIKLLEDAGLVVIQPNGRERYCQADMEPLTEVQQWITHYEQFWRSKLSALGTFLDNATEEPS